MAISLHATLRNNRGNQISDWAGTSAKIRLYTAAYALELVELICDVSDFAPNASGGVVTVNPVTMAAAIASGSAAIARVLKSDGTTMVMEGLTVTDSMGAGDVKLAQTGTMINSGQIVNVDSFVITEGNP